MTDAVLSPPVRRAKLLWPRLGAGVIGRQRLIDRLEDGLSQPLTLVVGPAGFGKTTLLCNWLTTARRPATWLSLDAADNDLASFVTHVVAAIRAAAPTMGATVLALLRTPQPSPPAMIGATLCEELLDLPEDLILVADDYHLITHAPIHEFVAALLGHPAPRFHLVLSSRTDPPLPVASLRAHGNLIEVRTADLRFTDEEAGSFLKQTTVDELDERTIASIQEQTEGWPAGLRLAAIALRNQAPSTLADSFASRGRQHVMDFLVEEVLAAQPEPVRAFLTRTAIVERITPSLADALLDSPPGLGGSQALLDGLARESLFVTALGESSNWFRYHHLFRDLLRHYLLVDIGERGVKALHARASAWFAERGMVDEAVQHALVAGDPLGAAALVEQHVQTALGQDDWPRLERWLRMLPDEVKHHRPGLLLAAAWVALVRDSPLATPHLTDRARTLLAAQGASTDAAAALHGEIAVLTAIAQVWRGDYADALDANLRALDELPADHAFGRGEAFLNLAFAATLAGRADDAIQLMHETLARESGRVDVATLTVRLALGVTHLLAGRLVIAEATLARLMRLLDRHELPLTRVVVHNYLGRIYYQWNRLDAAAEHFAAALTLRRWSNTWVQRGCVMGLALVSQARGRQNEVTVATQELTGLILEAGSQEEAAELRAFQAHLALLRGDVVPALLWLATNPDSPNDDTPMVFIEAPPLTRARALLADGSPGRLAAAQRLLGHLELRADGIHLRERAVEIHALTALVLDAQGQTEAALAALDDALRLGESGGYVRTFVDLGPPMETLLERLATRAEAMPYRESLLAAFADPLAEHAMAAMSGAPPHPTAASPGRPMLREPLSYREREILDGLRRRLSDKEIAAELSISPLTVKRHASNLYGKLGVSGRREAVDRAADLGLLPLA